MAASTIRAPGASAAALLLVAVALRWWDFGNPVIHVDEQYYLLVGDRMLQGAVPYIDIWDRKPVGLFLLFALIRLLPGDGILAYQIVATLFAAATAWIVTIAARQIDAPPRGALAAGVAYLVWLSLLGGRGGQSPVFYNLFIAAAALLTLRLPALAQDRAWRAILRNGLVACGLAGVAVQMKYVPLFEGIFFGLAHLWFLRRAGAKAKTLGGAALLWAAAGLAPTAAAIGWYAARGPAAFDAFWFANVTSIALRPGYPLDQIAMRLLGIVAQLSPLIVGAALGWRWRTRHGAAAARAAIAFVWLATAAGGFMLVGTFFDHYALPLVTPLAIVAAIGFGHSGRTLAASLGAGLLLFTIERIIEPRDGDGARQVAAIVAANSGGECPYVFIGDTITYHLAKTCLPTAYAFPNLLAYTTEQGATGIDEAAEVRRILANRPPVIVTSSRRLAIWNQGSIAALTATLRSDYRLVFSVARRDYRTLVYLRRDRKMVR